MDEDVVCPTCHVNIRQSDYYCFNCGKNLKPKPPSVSAPSQIALYIKSALMPPFGLYWAINYIKQPNRKSRIVGLTAIVVTMISLFYLAIITNNFIKNINQAVYKQLNSPLYF